MDKETLKRMSDIELVLMQHELRMHPEDKGCLDEVLMELGNREKGVDDGQRQTESNDSSRAGAEG